MDKRETILIVDDNPQVTEFLADSLLPSLGYHCLVCHDGATTVQVVREQPVALILIDMHLPDTDGLQVLRQLSREGLSRPAILMTAEGSEQIAVDAFRLGVQDYLIKPLDADYLNTAIARALVESRLQQEKSYLTAQLNSQVSWMAVLAKIGRSVTSTLELDEVLRRIVEAGVWLTHADEGFLALAEEDLNQVHLRAVKSIAENRSRTLNLPVTDSLLGKVIESGRPLRMVKDAEGAQIEVATGFLVHSLLYIPLISRGKTLGVLAVNNITAKRSFTAGDEALLATLADYAAVALENARLYRRLQQTAITDELTGLYNRRGLFELGRREVERSLRFGHQLPALMIDIDHFKEVNDTHGHATGDQVLQVLAQRFRRNVREIDIVGRYGGEEFAILLVENNLDSAAQIAERLRQLVASIPIQTSSGPVQVTVSIGVAAVDEQVKDLDELLQRADQALFLAKNAGRNSVSVLPGDSDLPDQP